MRISLCAIMKNEARRLDEFLQKMSPLVDEVVIVDTGSTDESVAIAKKYTDKVIQEDHFESFSLARNISLQHATGDWALIMDIDELIVEDDMEKIRKTLETSEYVAHRLLRYNYIGEGLWSTSNIVRLIKLNEGLLFSRKVHESIRDTLHGRKTPVINIYSHHFPDATAQKNELYMSWLEKYTKECSLDIYAQTHLIREYFAVGRVEKAFSLAQNAIQAGIDSDRIFANLGFMYLNLGNYEKAEAIFSSLYNSSVMKSKDTNTLPESIAAGLSIISYKKGYYEKSLSICLAQIDQNRNAAHPYINACANYLKLGALKEAEEMYQHALRKNPFLESAKIHFPMANMKNSIYFFDNVVIEDACALRDKI